MSDSIDPSSVSRSESFRKYASSGKVMPGGTPADSTIRRVVAIKAACQELSISRHTMYRMMDNGEIDYVLVHGRRRVELAAYLEKIRGQNKSKAKRRIGRQDRNVKAALKEADRNVRDALTVLTATDVDLSTEIGALRRQVASLRADVATLAQQVANLRR